MIKVFFGKKVLYVKQNKYSKMLSKFFLPIHDIQVEAKILKF